MACIVKRLNYSFDILEKWASKSNFYNKASFKTWVMPKWKSAEKYNFNEGTLHFLARKANEKDYQHIKTMKYKSIVEEFMKRKTDTDLAILFSKIFENIVCIDTKKQIFMIPDDFNKWEQHDKPTISKLLLEKVSTILFLFIIFSFLSLVLLVISLVLLVLSPVLLILSPVLLVLFCYYCYLSILFFA